MASDQSFMVTNRAHPTGITGQEPLPDGELWWYSAPEADEADEHAFVKAEATATTGAPPAFEEAVLEKLRAQSEPSLTVFIHGLDCFWTSAVKYTAVLAKGLASANYPGLVIGFSWPSNGADDLLHYASAYPQPADTETVRGRIVSSVASMGNLFSWLEHLVTLLPTLQVNVVCHSEGNYGLVQALETARTGLFTHTLLLAADIDAGAFQAVGGDAAGVSASSQDVTVYFGNNDPILAFSVGAFSSKLALPGTGAFHHPTFGARLGAHGPAYVSGAQLANLNSVDCTELLNDTYIEGLDLPETLTGNGLHDAYLFVPRILADMAATLTGGTTNRTPLAYPGAFALPAT